MGITGDQLPSEIIFEILTRTSMETMKQCTRVSDSWEKIINEPTFLPLHCKRSNCLFGFLLQGIKHHKYTVALISDEGCGGGGVTWPYEDMKILASSDDGILCCRRRICRNERYYACKPATNQWQPLPNPKLRYTTAAVALVVVQSQPLHYVVVRLSKNGKEYRCEMFDSRRWTWERIECTLNPSHAAIAIGASVYWLTLNEDILTFDVSARCFRRLPLPLSTQLCKYKQVVEYERKLGFMCMNEGNEVELWAMEEGQWRRKIVADTTRVGVDGPGLVGFCSSSVVMVKNKDVAAFCKVENKCRVLSRVQMSYFHVFLLEFFRFRSNLEIVNLKGGRS